APGPFPGAAGATGPPIRTANPLPLSIEDRGERIADRKEPARSSIFDPRIPLASRGVFWFYLRSASGRTSCDTVPDAAGAATLPSPLCRVTAEQGSQPVSLGGKSRMTNLPMQALAAALRQNGLVRFIEHFGALFPDCHLKDVVVDDIGPDRTMTVNGHTVTNFGSDSFLGLDQDPRVKEAVVRGVARWGTHNGASRAFSSVRANTDAEDRLAEWLGTEATLIYPSVTLANMGAIPGLVGRQDLLVVDEHAHNSIHEGAKIAKANGVPLANFSHCDPRDLERVLTSSCPYRCALVAIDGVYSMSGALPPLAELNAVCLAHNAVLYVDDAHGTGVLGRQGRGTVLDALGSYDNTFVIGSLSKAFSCAGGFIGCTRLFKKLLKMRSNTYIFGGPVVPPYLDAICTVCDI